MDFTISEDLQMLKDTVAHFVREELFPIEEKVEEQDEIPETVVEKMRKMGLFGITIPQEYGGLGLSMVGTCLLYEEISKASACFRTRIGTNNGIGSQGILMFGTEEQKRKYLPGIASGQKIACFALTEPNSGSDAAAMETTAVLRGDHWILNGQKRWTTNVNKADYVTVYAVTDKQKRARGGITAFVVEREFPGFQVGPVDKKMGMHGSHTCDLILDDCRVPKENVIGTVGDGFKVAMQVLDRGRLTMGACSVGSAQRLLDESISYAKTRRQFGQPIGSFQLIQAMLADSAAEIYAGRSMVCMAAWRKDQGHNINKDAAMAKLWCSEMVGRVADRAVQIHGGMGYMRGMAVERFYRDVRLIRIYEGTSEIQRLVVARELLKD
jgi:acyl-CoA dehydrogenase